MEEFVTKKEFKEEDSAKKIETKDAKKYKQNLISISQLKNVESFIRKELF